MCWNGLVKSRRKTNQLRQELKVSVCRYSRLQVKSVLTQEGWMKMHAALFRFLIVNQSEIKTFRPTFTPCITCWRPAARRLSLRLKVGKRETFCRLIHVWGGKKSEINNQKFLPNDEKLTLKLQNSFNICHVFGVYIGSIIFQTVTSYN